MNLNFHRMPTVDQIAIDSLPNHLRHLQHSQLFSGLVASVTQFHTNKIVDEKFIAKLVEAFACEFEKAFDRHPVNCKTLEISENSTIINYRFDRGYWELVVPDTTLVILDQSNGRSSFFRDSITVGIEGAGGGMRKGKRKSESIKRAHTRQVAKDTRWEGSSDDSEVQDSDDSGEWVP